MSAEIIHPSTDSFAPNVALTPGFFSLPSLANETWSLNDALPTPPPIPSWAVKPDPDHHQQPQQPSQQQIQPQKQLCIDPALQPSPIKTPPSKPPKGVSPPPHDPKRENFLARNRKAASKCRQKKKRHNKELESQYERVSRQKKQLQSEAEYLRAQVLQLKDELLRHSQCDDARIKGHLARMVSQVTRKSETFIDVKSLLASPVSGRSQSGSSVSASASAEADSPLLQEVMEMERRGEEWRRDGPALRRDDSFGDLIDYG